MLDDKSVISQRDPSGSLEAMLSLSDQMTFEPQIEGEVSSGFDNVVLAGMGGSALAADMIRELAGSQFSVPVEVVKGYSLPNYASKNTLVIAISHSGNTEETLSCYDEAKQRGCIVAIMAGGGKLYDKATEDGYVRTKVPSDTQPRMSTVYHLRALLYLLQQFEVINGELYDQVAGSAAWLSEQLQSWSPEISTEENLAKQIATQSAGKNVIFYGGQLTGPVAYKWKISWNESAKNIAFYNKYPEFNHNEFMGWTSHPIEKLFIVFDIRSSFELPRIAERMELTDKLLSGKRPKAEVIQLQGENLVQQMLWGLALADTSSIYLAILNNVDPTPVELIERFKKELS